MSWRLLIIRLSETPAYCLIIYYPIWGHNIKYLTIIGIEIPLSSSGKQFLYSAKMPLISYYFIKVGISVLVLRLWNEWKQSFYLILCICLWYANTKFSNVRICFWNLDNQTFSECLYLLNELKNFPLRTYTAYEL